VWAGVATPKDEIDHDTYGLFDLETGVPTEMPTALTKPFEIVSSSPQNGFCTAQVPARGDQE
jgi:hypothetical protein